MSRRKSVCSIATKIHSLSFRGQHQRVSAQPAVLPDLHRIVEHLHHVLHDPVSKTVSVNADEPDAVY